MSLLRQAARVAGKDLRIELRSREIVYTMAFFGGLLAVVFSFAFPRNIDMVRGAAPGMLWATIAFSGTIGLGRAFDRERENDTMRALLLACPGLPPSHQCVVVMRTRVHNLVG